MPPYPASVRIVEVGPRDGLQNETKLVPVDQKIHLIESLVAAGLTNIECGSYVSAKAVPSMADSAAVIGGINRAAGVTYSALIPNLKGLEAAMAFDLKHVAIFASASESFSEHNIRSSISHSLLRYRDVCSRAQRNGVSVRGYVSCVAGCPYEGPVAVESVLKVAGQLIDMGCYEVSLGDTIGVGTPIQIERLLLALTPRIPVHNLAIHFHDTYGQALANILVALQAGVSVVDSSAAGLGGCPYAPGAAGNVATEDVVYMLRGMNIETGIDLVKVAEAGRRICQFLGRTPASKTSLALAARG